MKRERLLFSFILFVILMGMVGCGKKGPPFLPDIISPAKVENLNAEWKNGSALLKGNLDPSQGRERYTHDVTGCRVYYAWYSAENPPCEGCPIAYQGFKEIKGDVLRGEGFYCEIAVIKKAGVHFFEVSLIGENGAIGPPSNRVKLTTAH